MGKGGNAPNKNGQLVALVLLESRLRRHEGLGRPLVHELVNLLHAQMLISFVIVMPSSKRVAYIKLSRV